MDQLRIVRWAVLLAVLAVGLSGVTGAGQAYRVIWDDDAEDSGIIALLFLLLHPEFEVVAATVAVGEADPPVQAARIAVMLEQLGYDIPVFYGRSTPLVGDNAFPQAWRDEVNRFFDVNLCAITCDPTVNCNAPLSQNITARPGAADAIFQVLDTMMDEFYTGVSTHPILLFAAGPLTNLYEAYQMLYGSWTADQIDEVSQDWIETDVMGGAIDVPGNLLHGFNPPMNTHAEFNIWIDPVAAAGIFQEPGLVHLTPLDVTNLITWTQADIQQLRDLDTCEAVLAAALLERMMTQQGNNPCWAWDLVSAALSVIRLGGGTFHALGQTWTIGGTYHCIDVIVSGAEQGWTRKCACPCDSPNVFVYDMSPQLGEALKEYIYRIFELSASS